MEGKLLRLQIFRPWQTPVAACNLQATGAWQQRRRLTFRCRVSRRKLGIRAHLNSRQCTFIWKGRWFFILVVRTPIFNGKDQAWSSRWSATTWTTVVIIVVVVVQVKSRWVCLGPSAFQDAKESAEGRILETALREISQKHTPETQEPSFTVLGSGNKSSNAMRKQALQGSTVKMHEHFIIIQPHLLPERVHLTSNQLSEICFSPHYTCALLRPWPQLASTEPELPLEMQCAPSTSVRRTPVRTGSASWI